MKLGVWEVTKIHLKKKKISAICVVATSSEFIKNNRKHSRVSNTKKGNFG